MHRLPPIRLMFSTILPQLSIIGKVKEAVSKLATEVSGVVQQTSPTMGA